MACCCTAALPVAAEPTLELYQVFFYSGVLIVLLTSATRPLCPPHTSWAPTQPTNENTRSTHQPTKDGVVYPCTELTTHRCSANAFAVLGSIAPLTSATRSLCLKLFRAFMMRTTAASVRCLQSSHDHMTITGSGHSSATKNTNTLKHSPGRKRVQELSLIHI